MNLRSIFATLLALAGVVLLIPAVTVDATLPQDEPSPRQVTADFNKSIQPKKNAVSELATAVQGALRKERWCTSGSQCSDKCGYHACDKTQGSDSELTCTDKLLTCNCAGDSCDLCKDYEDSNKRIYNFQRPNYYTPPGKITSKGNNQSILITDDIVRRDICSLKTIEQETFNAHNNNNLTAWFYVATVNGAFSMIPSTNAFCRDDTKDDPLLTCSFDPTTRPWYITAATGPRDIVFMFDGKIESSSSLYNSMLQSLGQLDRRDAISLRIFDDSSLTTQIGPSSGMTLATVAVRKELSNEFKKKQFGFSGRSNVTTALSEAFDILQKAKDDTNEPTSACKRYIVLMIGSEDSCFDPNNGRCTSSSTCDCVSKMKSLIATRQRAFDTPVSIIVFTQSKSSMDVLALSNMERVGSSLACPHGIWSRVTSADGGNGMIAFPKFGAFLLFDRDDESTRKIFSSEVYDDAGNLGKIFTLAAPVYDVTTQSLVAVVGADITVNEVKDTFPTSVSDEEIEKQIDLFSKESRQCTQGKDIAELECDANDLRSSLPASKRCPERERSSDCMRFGSVIYTRGEIRRSFNDADKYCRNLIGGGSLAVIDETKKNIFFTSLTDDDGTWIGATGSSSSGELKWTSASNSENAGKVLEFNEFDMDSKEAMGELSNIGISWSCVSADRRGSSGNWNIEPCSKILPFVCEVRDSNYCRNIDIYEESCSNFENPRKCENSEDIESADPLCKQSGKGSSESGRKCCGPLKNSSSTSTPDPGGPGGSGGFPSWAIAVIVTGVLVVLGIISFIVYRRRGNGNNDEAVQEESYVGSGESVVSHHQTVRPDF